MTKRKSVMLMTVLFSTTQMFAASSGSTTSTFNTIFSEYGTPIAIALIILSGVTGLIMNLDKINDHKGDGTRKEGIMNCVYIMGGTTLVVLFIAGVVAIAKGVTIAM